MTIGKELMDKFIKSSGKETFSLLYKSMTGNFKSKELTEEEKVMSQCIKNECTSKDGACYKYYQEIKKAKKSNDIQKLSILYEAIIEIMCEKVFYHSIKLGYILKNNFQ